MSPTNDPFTVSLPGMRVRIKCRRYLLPTKKEASAPRGGQATGSILGLVTFEARLKDGALTDFKFEVHKKELRESRKGNFSRRRGGTLSTSEVVNEHGHSYLPYLLSEDALEAFMKARPEEFQMLHEIAARIALMSVATLAFTDVCAEDISIAMPDSLN